MTRMTVSRRGLLAGAMGLAAGSRSQAATVGEFTHGVASGDPLATRIILWTRFVPETGNAASINWEIASDGSFAEIIKRGTAKATPARDFTVKVDVTGLKPGTRYAYRFHANENVSATGHTRTMPTGAVDSVRLAVFSCANLPFGYFHAYRDAALRDDIDFALHLGDYIYEYQAGNYPSAKQALAGRLLDPPTAAVHLADYRKRYASYRIDPDLQAIHAKVPMIAVWDDHELANDTWRGGAENHHPDEDGPWALRRAAAMQVWHEWLPVREQKAGKIYRRFDIGTLASLIMLDTRAIGRDKQLNYKTDLAVQDTAPRPEVLGTVAKAFRRKWLDPKRSLMGAPQESWFAAQLKDSAAKNIRWQVIGQQIQAGFLKMPAELPAALPADAPDWLRSRVELGAAMATEGLPSNLDAWNGYPAARDRFIAALRDDASNAIILSGDTHNAWLFHLGEKDGTVAAVEFGGQSVTSPGYESSVKIPQDQLQSLLLKNNAELKWCNAAQRGYMVTMLTPDAAINEWIFLDTIRDKAYAIASRATAQVDATPGKGTAKAQITAA
jgi:alkaline phosphatase D